MSIHSDLYIVTEQVKQQAEHDGVSVIFVGDSPKEANHSFARRANHNHRYTFHHVKLNSMGASDVKKITYSDLISAAQSFRKLDASEDSEETHL